MSPDPDSSIAAKPSLRQRVWRFAKPAARFAGPALLTIAYLWFALHYIGAHRYQMNPDGVGYLSLARQYAAGDFHSAVSAYWSPLYSWLLVPFLLAGIEPLLATKVLGLFIGGATIHAMWRFGTFAAFPRNVKVLICAAAIPVVVDAAYQVTTPDLLVACTVLYYLAAFINPGNAPRWTGAMRIGLTMGIAYLAKAYALPFVLAHFVLVRLIELIKAKPPHTRLHVVRSSCVALAAGALIVGSWSAVLSSKFGYFMTGSTGRYNVRIDAPRSPGQVMHFAGYLPPPNATATSAWDDITYHIDLLPAWSPFDSPANRQWFWDNIRRNVEAVREQLEWFSPWCYPILLMAALIALSRADLRLRRPGLMLAGAALLYPCGYLLLHIERRFLVPLALLMLLSAGYAIGRAAARGLLNGWWRTSLAAAAIGATFVANPVSNLERSRNTNRSTVELADKLRGVLPSGANIASDGSWSPSLYLAFLSSWHYFGEAKPGQSREAILADLDRLGVEYLLIWRNPRDWPARSGWSEVPMATPTPFKIYRRNAATTHPTSAATGAMPSVQ